MASSGALPRTGGALFRPASAPTFGHPGGPSQHRQREEQQATLLAQRSHKGGCSVIYDLPPTERYKQYRGGYQGSTFGPPPGR